LAERKGNRQIKQAEPQTRRICFRLSEAEYTRAVEDLAVCGLSLSAYVRKRLSGQRIASKADLAVLAELRRLGGLLKHVHNETRGAYSDLTRQAIKDLSAYVRALTAKQRSVPNQTEGNP
jgi:phosphate uptake regulator